MATITLTQLAVDRRRAPAAGREDVFDRLLPGFGLRVSAGGHKSWILFYRCNGRQRRFTLGPVAAIPKVDDARDRARELLREVARGIDPAEAKAEGRKPAAPAPRPDTVAVVSETFIARYARPKNKSWAIADALLRRHVIPRWGDRDVASITRRDVRELLDELVDAGHPIAANRVLACVRTLFRWCVERDIIVTSAAANVKAPSKEVTRDRVLSDDELTLLWNAADRVGGATAAFIELLILLGQRRNEVAAMRWADVDLDRAIWTLPRTATKGDRSHEVPLSPLAVEVIRALPRVGEHVLGGGRRDGRDVPLSGFAKRKIAVEAKMLELAGLPEDAELPIGGWRLHDLRRTCGTGLARHGVPLVTISRILNHAEGGVTRIYARYSFLDEKREALDRWAAHVEGLLRPAPANVVALRGGGG